MLILVWGNRQIEHFDLSISKISGCRVSTTNYYHAHSSFTSQPARIHLKNQLMHFLNYNNTVQRKMSLTIDNTHFGRLEFLSLTFSFIHLFIHLNSKTKSIAKNYRWYWIGRILDSIFTPRLSANWLNGTFPKIVEITERVSCNVDYLNKIEFWAFDLICSIRLTKNWLFSWLCRHNIKRWQIF